MREIITVINQKGGVGKTTTALNIGAGLKSKGYKVLFIDLDAQCNLSYSLKANSSPLSSLEVLTKTATAKEVIQQTELGDIIPASPSLAGADNLITEIGKEYRLREAVAPIQAEYDYIIIDTPPALSILTINALVVSNSVIIPVQADTYSLQGLGGMADTINQVKQYCNPALTIKGIVITRYNSRAILTRDITEYLNQVAGQLNTKVFSTKVRECIAIKEAQTVQQDLFIYAPKSNGAVDYNNLIIEITED